MLDPSGRQFGCSLRRNELLGAVKQRRRLGTNQTNLWSKYKPKPIWMGFSDQLSRGMNLFSVWKNKFLKGWDIRTRKAVGLKNKRSLTQICISSMKNIVPVFLFMATSLQVLQCSRGIRTFTCMKAFLRNLSNGREEQKKLLTRTVAFAGIIPLARGSLLWWQGRLACSG